MSSDLYREEAIRHLGASHLGEARLDSAAGFLKMTTLLVGLLAIVLYFLGTSTYTRKHPVIGQLDQTNASIIIAADLGRLTQLNVNEGDHVNQGDLLGRIQNLRGNHVAQIRELESQQKKREELMIELSAGHKERLGDFDQRESQINQLLRLTRADVQLQSRKVNQLQSQINKTARLRKQGYLSNLDWVTFETNLIAEQQALNQVKTRFVELIGQRANVASSRRDFVHQSRLQTSELALTLSQTRAQLAALNLQQAQKLIASISGIVTRIDTPIGGSVTPGQPVMYLSAKDQSYSGTVLLPSHVAGHLDVGTALALELDSYPAETYGRIPAVVSQISSHTVGESEHSATFVARLQLESQSSSRNTQVRLMPGMQFTTYVEVDSNTLFRRIFKPVLSLIERVR